MGKPAATDRPRLTPLSHSFTLDLEAYCRKLADNPELGRACDHVRPGLRHMEHGRHVLFYRIEAKGTLVSRILHQRMLPERQGIDEEDAGPDRR